jgi:hypothetical protein
MFSCRSTKMDVQSIARIYIQERIRIIVFEKPLLSRRAVG